jgi:hypothetical protein
MSAAKTRLGLEKLRSLLALLLDEEHQKRL